MERDQPPNEEAFLELDDTSSGDAAPRDPTPELPIVPEGESFLEVFDESVGGVRGRGRVVSDDDLRMVTALADDGVPLLAALWPSAPDLLASAPDEGALRERVALARTALNQVTRRGAEWRARSEVAGAALTRRLDDLRRRTRSSSATVDAAMHGAARDDLRAWHVRALEERVRAEAAGQGRVYADGARRLAEEARRRGLGDEELLGITGFLGVEMLPGEVAPWTPCTVLPGAPRTLDAVADALVSSQAQGVASLRDGSLVGWIRANRGPDELVAAAQEAQALAQDAATPGAALTGLWWLVWALGRDGVLVDGQTVTGPETLLAHLRGARLHASSVAGAAPVLARWFRLKGHGVVAGACDALARGDAHATLRLRWSLGEPLRLGDRAVTDPAALAREVLARQGARAAALEAWRSGTLRAWLDTLPRARRDALWLEDLAHAPAHEHDESAFWRGVYRRVPRAALRVYLDDGAEGRAVRFQTVADLRATARLAAVWEPLARCHRSGELRAWLSVAAPGVELDGGDDDASLHALLAALGHAGLVLPWGRAGYAVSSPADLVTAWKRAWHHLEAQLAQGHVTAWLRRFHPTLGVMGVTLEQALDAWGPTLGAGAVPAGVASLRLALLCGLEELPLEPQRPMVRGVVRGYRKVAPLARDASAWEPLWHEGSVHRAHGTLLLWVARHVPSFGVLAMMALTDPSHAEDCASALASAGVPVPTDALATEHLVAEREGARLAAERDAARLADAREAAARAAQEEAAQLAAEREEARLATERDRVRREVEREVARLTAERDAAHASMAHELARIGAERELTRAASERELSRLTAERDAARLEVEQARVRFAMERDAAKLEAERLAARAAAERDEARLEAERARLERDIARLEAEQVQRRAQRAREAADQSAAEVEASRLQEVEASRRQAELEASRLRALEEQARTAAGREASRIAALEDEARRDAARREAELAALADEARRAAEEEAARVEAIEAEARRETSRRAEEAAEAAARMADEARRRAAADEEAEELARRLLTEREAAREAAWAARRVAAEREIARLAEAERKARALAAELTRDDAVEETPTAQALEALAEIEGALDEDAPVDDVAEADEAPEVLPERRELRVEALIASQPVDDEETLARVRAVVGRWSRRQSGLSSSEPSSGVELLSVTARPAFEAHVTTRMESRALRFVPPPWRDDDEVPVPPEATAPGASVDPWALELPEVEAWTAWRAEFLLDTAPIRSLCRACEHGRVPCSECRGGGERTCPACNGRVRIRCVRCAGAGEIAGAKGPVRCPGCLGRRDQPCSACAYGRVACARCSGKKTLSCARCRGLGQLTERVAVLQTYEGVAAASVVPGALPDAVARDLQTRDTDPLAVVHIEAAEIDPYTLARELPHAELGASVAQLLADEAARVREGQRVTRQRLVVRRYAAYEVRCRLDGEAYALWVHGARDLVHADTSPRARKVEAFVEAAREAIAREELLAAVDALSHVQELDPEHAEALSVATALGDAVLAMARRGELFEARDVAAKARPLRWSALRAKVVEVERLLGDRLQVRSPWALAEEARAALERGRDDRCAERLTQLSALEPDHAEGARLASELGQRLAAQAGALIDRGDLAAAATVIARATAVPFASCGAGVREVTTRIEARQRAQQKVALAPWAIAAVATLVALAALLAR